MSACAGGCGREKPDVNASYAGWRRGFCPRCYAIEQGYPPSTERVRRYRADPEKRDRDLAAARRWKDENRERNRARDRAYHHRKRNEAA